jgi:hypothetical protein
VAVELAVALESSSEELAVEWTWTGTGSEVDVDWPSTGGGRD